MSGSRRAYTAVAAAAIASGTISNQKRRRRISRMSSGLYVLPGSISAPSTFHQRHPRAQIHADGVTARPWRKKDWKSLESTESVLVVGIVDANPQIARDSFGESGRRIVRAIPLCGFRKTDLSRDDSGARLKLKTPDD